MPLLVVCLNRFGVTAAFIRCTPQAEQSRLSLSGWSLYILMSLHQGPDTKVGEVWMPSSPTLQTQMTPSLISIYRRRPQLSSDSAARVMVVT
jgi:hypothetical protein